MIDYEGLLTAGEVSERLRLPMSTVYYLAKTGRIRAFRVGRSWRFPSAVLAQLSSAKAPLILVADDDRATRVLVRSVLESRGCHVREATSAGKALRLAQAERFDVLFIDCKLSRGEGLNLIAELRGEYAPGEIVVIAALPDLAEGNRLGELGAVTLMAKPLVPAQVAVCVERITRSSPSPVREEGTHVGN